MKATNSSMDGSMTRARAIDHLLPSSFDVGSSKSDSLFSIVAVTLFGSLKVIANLSQAVV